MVTYSILAMLGLGMAAAVLLAAASKVFAVKENPKIVAAMELLPGANCGGCGFAGCEGYATAVVTNPDVPANRCCASSSEAIVALAELVGKTVAEADPLVAMRRCDVYAGNVAQRYEYQGIPSCAAASLLRGGTNTCSHSCLGYGDCVRACPFDAMHIVGGLACVDIGSCTGCGTCVSACPRGVLELIPARARICVPCNSRDKAKVVTETCGTGCIKCGRCVRTCPAKALSVVDGRIEIDHKLCLSYGRDCREACVDACKRLILRRIDLLNQRVEPVPAVKPEQEKPEAPEAPAAVIQQAQEANKEQPHA